MKKSKHSKLPGLDINSELTDKLLNFSKEIVNNLSERLPMTGGFLSLFSESERPEAMLGMIKHAAENEL